MDDDVIRAHIRDACGKTIHEHYQLASEQAVARMASTLAQDILQATTWTQGRLAYILEVSDKSVQNWLRGERAPNDEHQRSLLATYRLRHVLNALPFVDLVQSPLLHLLRGQYVRGEFAQVETVARTVAQACAGDDARLPPHDRVYLRVYAMLAWLNGESPAGENDWQSAELCLREACRLAGGDRLEAFAALALADLLYRRFAVTNTHAYLEAACAAADVATKRAPNECVTWITRLCGASLRKREAEVYICAKRFLKVRTRQYGARDAIRQLRSILESDADFGFALNLLGDLDSLNNRS